MLHNSYLCRYLFHHHTVAPSVSCNPVHPNRRNICIPSDRRWRRGIDHDQRNRVDSLPKCSDDRSIQIHKDMSRSCTGRDHHNVHRITSMCRTLLSILCHKCTTHQRIFHEDHNRDRILL